MAEQQRFPARFRRLPVVVHCNAGLAATGDALDAQPQGRHRDVVYDLAKFRIEPVEALFLPVDIAVDIRHDIEALLEEAMHPFSMAAAVSLTVFQKRLDGRRQLVLPGGVHDSPGVETGGVQAPDPVVGAIEQVVEFQVFVVLLAEFAAQAVEIAMELADHVLGLAAIALVQTVAALDERAVFLLDEQNPAGAVDDDKIDFAEGGAVFVGAGPIDAVIDGEVPGEPLFQQSKRLTLAISRAGKSEVRNGRNEAGQFPLLLNIPAGAGSRRNGVRSGGRCGCRPCRPDRGRRSGRRRAARRAQSPPAPRRPAGSTRR